MSQPVTTKTAICNLALDRVRQVRINSIDPPTTETEQTLAENYDQARQYVLRLHAWNFAKKRAYISRVADAPVFDFADAYQLPTDFVRLLSVGGTVSTSSTALGGTTGEVYQERTYDLQNRLLLINNAGAATLKLRYIYDNENVPEWDATFKELVILHLALAIAYKITGKEKLVERLEQQISRVQPDAASIDALERPPIRIQRSKYLDAHRRNIRTPGYLVPDP